MRTSADTLLLYLMLLLLYTTHAHMHIQTHTGTVGVTITAVLSGTGTDVFTWSAPAGIVITAQTPAAGTATASSTVTFNAPVIPANTVNPVSLSFSVIAGTGAAASDTQSALVTVNPPSDIVQLTAVLFRCDKHRMVLTATSSVINANVQLTLQKYTDNTGVLRDPATLGNSFTNTGAYNVND
jgi:hypothetical protein